MQFLGGMISGALVTALVVGGILWHVGPRGREFRCRREATQYFSDPNNKKNAGILYYKEYGVNSEEEWIHLMCEMNVKDQMVKEINEHIRD